MDFRQLESFTSVVKEGSFTKAAERLFLSQSTVSMHVRQLEEELGTCLIRRTTKNVELTDQGKEINDYAVSILGLRRRMFMSCEKSLEDSLLLGASTIPSAYILPEVLPAFMAKHPETKLEIKQDDSQSVISRLKEGVIDVGLVGMRTYDDELEFTPFCSDHMIIVAPVSEKYQKISGPKGVMKMLMNDPVILREKGSGSRTMAGRFLKSIGVSEEDLNVIARINDQETIKYLVEGGMGISVISERAAREEVKAGKLLKFEVPNVSTDRNLYVVVRRNAVQPAASLRFIKFITDWYSAETEA